ncbi:MAG TPA: FHA domain-containing protein, partial [Variovorax sp.]|nr:FHA domain-containing protein [Variovorax sp.]
MIQIAVITRQGAPGEKSQIVQFGPAGGTIGRADTNTLVLSDPDRTVSRVHAQVLCRSGQYFVIDRGSNPIVRNGQPLGSGNEALLSDGDRLVIGGFELKVEVQAAIDASPAPSFAPAPSAPIPASSEDDPFADLLAGLAPPPQAPVTGTAAAAAKPLPSASSASADSLLFSDPMQSGSRNAQAALIDPFADLLGSASSSAPATGVGALDDFSDLGAPPASGKAAGIDELFGGVGGGGGIG